MAEIVIYSENQLELDTASEDFKKYVIPKSAVFTDIEECMDYIKKNDVLMFWMYANENIGELIKEINEKKFFGKIGIFVFGKNKPDDLSSKYYDKFLQEPVSLNDLQTCADICHAIYRRFKPKTRVVTFGYFDLFLNGEAVCFHNKKAKELFALCVDKMGGVVNICEAVDAIWQSVPDPNTKKRYRNAVRDIRKALEEYGIYYIFSSSRGECHVNISMIESDVMDFINNPQENIEKFRGDYMSGYPWAEKTTYELAKIVSEYRCKYGVDFF